MLFPRELSEYGKYYSAFDDAVHNGTSYTDTLFGIRTERSIPYWFLPNRTGSMQWLAHWCKCTSREDGCRCGPTLLNQYHAGQSCRCRDCRCVFKSFRGYDTNLAYEAVRKDAMVPPDCDTKYKWGDRDPWTSNEARGGLSYYHSLGYVPVDRTAESVSRYDWIFIWRLRLCVAQMASAMGKTNDYKQLMIWSKNYQNVYNTETGFFAPRKFDGSFYPREKENEGFTEGDKWTYTFGAMHDAPGMIELMEAIKNLQPCWFNFNGIIIIMTTNLAITTSIFMIFCGQPWKTQELVRVHTRINYRNEPLGLMGTMTADRCRHGNRFGIDGGFYPALRPDYIRWGSQFPELTRTKQTPRRPAHKLTICSKKSIGTEQSTTKCFIRWQSYRQAFCQP